MLGKRRMVRYLRFAPLFLFAVAHASSAPDHASINYKKPEKARNECKCDCGRQRHAKFEQTRQVRLPTAPPSRAQFRENAVSVALQRLGFGLSRDVEVLKRDECV